MRIRNSIVTIIAILFIILWVYAGLSKLFDYREFKFQLGRSPYLEQISGFVAGALPMAEILIAFGLIFLKTRLLALYLSFFTMFLFTGYIYAMLKYSHFVPCSCGGILNNLDWNSHLIFNLIFTGLAVIAIFLDNSEVNIQPVLFKK